MGKKRIATQGGDSDKLEQALGKASKSVGVKKFERGRFYVNATYNNTIMTLTDEKGNTVAWLSAGTLGFSGPKKATPFAASKIVTAIAEKVKKSGPFKIHVVINGVGSGRDAALRSMPTSGFEILSITDVTPVPHNGPRPPKLRRV